MPNRFQRGQAMVEFLVIVFVLLLLILGALQFGLIYHAKTALNYAAFETARAGSVNNARMWSMELAFARSLAPLYTTPYRSSAANGPCVAPAGTLNDDGIDIKLTQDSRALDQAFASGGQGIKLANVYCARATVRQMLADQYARILLINPSPQTFASGHGVVKRNQVFIPNDNLMYRSNRELSGQSIQDANLIKVHVGLCYELIVPIVNRFIAGFTAFAPNDPMAPGYQAGKLTPGNFGAPPADSFARKCSLDPYDADPNKSRFGIPIYAHAVMRMQSDAIMPGDDGFCAGYCP